MTWEGARPMVGPLFLFTWEGPSNRGQGEILRRRARIACVRTVIYALPNPAHRGAGKPMLAALQ
jgi:hypothetical protein